MKVLWLSHLVPYPPKGGVLQRAYYLLAELSKYHQVDLIAFNQVDLIAPLFNSVQEGIDEAKSVLQKICGRIEFVGIDSDEGVGGKYLLALNSLWTKDPYNINWLKSREFTKTLIRFLSEENYDLVHFDTISLVPYLQYVADLPTVLDHHNIESHMLLPRAENEKNLLKKWYFRQEGKRLCEVEKNACPCFSLNITCSDADTKRLKKLSAESNVETIPNGVDTEYFKVKDSESQSDVTLVFAGTLSWYPNMEAVRFIAHELWPRLKMSNPDVSIDIIGANPPKDIVALSKVESRFRVHGFVDDVRPYLDKATIYVCPITDGGGTKLKILDAFAMEKAVVAHPIACEGINVEEGKNVLFAKTAEQYVEQIDILIKDVEYRRGIGRKARRLVEQRYSYDTIGRNLSDLYSKLLDEKSVHATVGR